MRTIILSICLEPVGKKQKYKGNIKYIKYIKYIKNELNIVFVVKEDRSMYTLATRFESKGEEGKEPT